ncbi:hypothetical protein C8N46_106105 [Kordia periserrulae]|uniref:Uncharacterized protein n=1 Tax=Kordia periserrulae TaxID=701523 RepID=A0A2T6BWK9_9FLAO|nr:hypothetical protein [Kordia periserrulae]PTX60461.1 hypothetical protein C8N46_106105 [Kordia periserrulae]
MKKLFILCLLLIVLVSCSRVRKVTDIESFDKEITEIIYPKKEGSYTTYRVTIKGTVNDSVLFEFRDNGLPFYFTGKVDFSIPTDYYGGLSKKFIFKPYKATAGKLTVEQVLQ